MEASLRDMLKHGRKWERMRTDEPGVFIRKIPRSKDNPAYLAVEINPIGESGIPINKMGIIIRSQSELDAIRSVLSKERVDEVIQEIEKASQP
ncbi:MAG: hypothetical protein RTU92_02480 [Candidatus Thorarchaeota archaeon]